MSKVDFKIYAPILKTRPAWRFDIGAFFMRFISFLATVGVVSMLTLSGYSTLLAGTIASVGAFATFILSPRVSRLIDVKGQGRVIPLATAVSMVGLLLLLAVVYFELPFWLCYPAEILLGFVPHGPSIARARWTYLLKGPRYKDELTDVEIKQVFSYEGILDDLGFMIAPALAIALNVAIHPIAGLLIGGLCYVAGALLLLSSRDTEPEVGWGSAPAEEQGEKRRSVFFISAPVRIAVAILFAVGFMFGVVDTVIVIFGDAIGWPTFPSYAMSIGSVASMAGGILFGALKLPFKLRNQWVFVAVAFGLFYAGMALVTGAPLYFVFNTVGSLFYAPLIIICNTAVESSVPSDRLTEAITFISAGMIVGMAFGPTVGGMVVDYLSVYAGLDAVAIVAACIALIALACIPVLRRRMG